MTQGATRARVLHWFVRGGIARTPDGKEIAIDVDPLVVGRDEGAQIRLADPEVSALHCELRAERGRARQRPRQHQWHLRRLGAHP